MVPMPKTYPTFTLSIPSYPTILTSKHPFSILVISIVSMLVTKAESSVLATFHPPGQYTLPPYQGHCHCPHYLLVPDTMTHLMMVEHMGLWAHRDAPQGWGCYPLVYEISIYSISCHNCYKARNRCYDYLNTATPPHV